MTKTTATRRCANPQCKRELTGRVNRKFCSTRCSSAVAYARKTAAEEAAGPQAALCYACKHPADRQAEPIAPAGKLKRHPFKGERPEFSGYCVDDECPCATCHPENAGKPCEPEKPAKPKTQKRDIVGKCPLPKLRSDVLRTAHKRMVRDGLESCSCGTTEGTVA